MAAIILNHNMVGLSNKETRSTLSSASWKREEVEFIDPLDHSMIIPPRSDIPLVITQNAERTQGYIRDDRADDYLAQFEKQYAVSKLATKDGFDVNARDTSARYGAAKEWDSFVLSVDQSVSDAELGTIRDIVRDELRSPSVMGYLDADGKTIPFAGMNGKRAILMSTTHENTGARHVHILVNRHAFDMGGKQVSAAVDFSRAGVVQTVVDTIKVRIEEAGITNSFGALTARSKAVTENTMALQASQISQSQLAAAGATNKNTTVGVEVRGSDGQTQVVAAPLTPDLVGMQTQSAQTKKDLERINIEIERLQAEAKAKAEAAAKMDQAIQVLAENEVLRSRLETTQDDLIKEQTQVVGLNTQVKELTEMNETLTIERDEAQADKQALREALVGLGYYLADNAKSLAINVEMVDNLQRGERHAIRDVVEQVSTIAGNWNEALDRLTDDVANQLREDPVESLESMVNELLEQRQQLPALIHESHHLKLELDAMQQRMQDMEKKLVAKEAEHEATLRAMVEKLAVAEETVAEAEKDRKLAAQSLAEEQHRAKTLERTKNALTNIIMNGVDPSDVYQRTPEVRDDASVLKTIEKWMEVRDKLNVSKDKISNLQYAVDNLPYAAQEALILRKQMEEELGIINDVGANDIKALVKEYKLLKEENDALLKKAHEQTTKDATKAVDYDELGLPTTLVQTAKFLQNNPDLLNQIQSLESDPVSTKAMVELLQELNQTQAGLVRSDEPPVTDYTQTLLNLNDERKPKGPSNENNIK